VQQGTQCTDNYTIKSLINRNLFGGGNKW